PTLLKRAGAMIPASVAMMAMVTRSSMSVNPARLPTTLRSFLDNTKHLLHGGKARFNLRPCVGAERNETVVDGKAAQLGARRLAGDGVLDVVGEDEELEDPDATAETAAAAGGAPGAPRQPHVTHR